MTVYALVVAAGAIPVTAGLARWPKRPTLLVLLAMYAASNLLIVAAGAVGSFPLALLARVLGGLAHAGMFSVVIATAVALAPTGKAARAVAVVNLGVSAALTLGVPLGTAAGTAWGWQGVFVAVAAALLAVAVAARALLPTSTAVDVAPTAPASPGSGVIRSLAHRPLMHVALITAVLSLGHYTAYTYVAPIVLHAGIGVAGVSAVLLAHGLASIPGLLLAGAFGDRHPAAALRSAMALAGVCLLVVAALPQHPVAVVAAIAVWGTAFGALPSLLQTAALRVSPSRDAAPAIVNSMFNIGIAAGAWTGGRLLLIDVTILAPTGAALLALASVLTLVRRTGEDAGPPRRGQTLSSAPAPRHGGQRDDRMPPVGTSSADPVGHVWGTHEGAPG
jgi:predicted MFS family arabinose efflux permease